MSTRSIICKENQDGTIEAIYCHCDGYLEHNGYILQNYYNDRSSIEQLINMGDISFLDKEIGEYHIEASIQNDFSSKYVDAYHRDHGEELKIHHYSNREELKNKFKDDVFIEYVYLFSKDNQWILLKGAGYNDVSLKGVLEDEEIEELIEKGY
jgi:guanylate kinase